MVYNVLVMNNLLTLAHVIANKNKKAIRRVTDNYECAFEYIFIKLVKASGKTVSALSEDELEKYHEATDSAYNSIADYLEYLCD